jgi:hypothetical protein
MQQSVTPHPLHVIAAKARPVQEYYYRYAPMFGHILTRGVQPEVVAFGHRALNGGQLSGLGLDRRYKASQEQYYCYNDSVHNTIIL